MSSFISRFVAILEASRPLLWLFSVASTLSGMFMAVKGLPPIPLLILVSIEVGPCVTAALNLLNAVMDVEVDKLSKANRPLPTKRLSVTLALSIALLLYFVGLVVAFLLGFWPFILTLVGVVLSVLYSIPPVKIKARGGFSNFALAFGYTALCFLFGWSVLQVNREIPWLILVWMMLQVSGANIVKDFVDYEADKEMKIGTLPVKYGVKKSLMIMAPFCAGIYLTIPIFYFIGYLSWMYLPITVFFVFNLYFLNSLHRDFSRKNREKIFVYAFLTSLFTLIAFTMAYVLA